jgi:GntR family transcriptional regulator
MLIQQDKKPKGSSSVQDVIPLYYKVYEVIRRQIERGDYPQDTPLPGEHELANQFAVSRVTIRRTMLMLEDADMITRLRGRGTFVNPGAIVHSAPENYSGFDQNIRDFEATTHVDLIRSDVTDLPAWGVDENGEQADVSRVLCIEYTRSAEKIPFSHIRAYVPMRIADKLKVEDLGNKTVTTAIEEAGTIVIGIDQKLTAIAADEIEAKCLRLPLGQPLIRVQRVMFDADRCPVQFVEAVYNPKYFEYHVSLSREKHVDEAPKWVPTVRQADVPIA